MGRTKESVRQGLSRFLVASRLTAIGRRLPARQGAIVLMGHRVAPDDEGYLAGLRPDWFEEQVSYLSRHHELISLSALVRCFEENREPPARSAVLTFDDGFRDNLEQAMPVLERHRAPATVFLVTGSISTGEMPWSQRLGFLFQRTKATGLDDELIGTCLELSSGAARRRAYGLVKGRMKGFSRAEREKALDRIARQLGVDPPRDRMLSWANVREMAARGIEFGAHTYSHPLLACISRDEARWEMERSRADLQEQLGVESPHFVFPGGSCSPELVATARALGFRSCFQSSHRRRINRLGNTDQFALSRVGLPNSPGCVLEAELDGPFRTLRQLYRWR